MSEAERISTNETGSDDRSLRNRAIEAYDSALDGASGAGRRAGDAIQETPLIALGAGAVIGAIFAAMLPTSLRERRLLGPYGK